MFLCLQVMVKEAKPRGGRGGTSAKAVLRIAKDEIKRLRQVRELALPVPSTLG